ncbi:MAG: NAD-binding protein, partial [Candidatus Latescibacterota bacterium]
LVSRSTGNSWCWQHRVPRLLEGDTSASPVLDMWHKALALGTTLGREAGVPLFTINAVFQVYEMARAMGLGQKDGYTAMEQMYERMAGIEPRPRRER